MSWLDFIYLAGPIGSVGQDGHTWRQEAAKALLTEFGIGTYSPAGAFSVGDATGRNDRVSRVVLNVNLAAVSWSDAVLAVLPDGKQSLGSIREIHHARSRYKPVVVVTSARRGHFACDLEIVSSLSEAYAVIRDWKQGTERRVYEWYNCQNQLEVP